MEVLQPVIERRIEKRKNNDTPGGEENDGIEWTLDLTSDKDMDPHQLSHEVLHNLFAGSLAPGALITEMVYQAMTIPGLVEELRQEAEKALAEHGWSEKLLQDLALQDSFIRELNRVYPTGSSKYSPQTVI